MLSTNHRKITMWGHLRITYDKEFGIWSLDWELNMGGEGQESQFHRLFFMQAAIIAYNICTAKQHSN